MKKFLMIILIIGIIVGTYFGIRYEIDYYNDKYDLGIGEKDEHTDENLDSIVSKLTIPVLYNQELENSISSYFFSFDKLDNLSSEEKLLIAVNNLYDKEYDKQDNTVKLKSSVVKEYYESLFGEAYTPQSFSQSIIFSKIDSNYNGLCHREYNYDKESDIYNIILGQCGGRVGPAIWKSYLKKVNIEKVDNQIYIDYAVASYSKNTETNEVNVYDKIFDKEIEKVNDETAIENLIKENKISTYRYIYEKGKNENYYYKGSYYLNNK